MFLTLFTAKETREQSSKRISQRITKLWSLLFLRTATRSDTHRAYGEFNNTVGILRVIILSERNELSLSLSLSAQNTKHSRYSLVNFTVPLRDGENSPKAGAWNIHPSKWLSPGVSHGGVWARRCLLFTRKSSAVMQRPWKQNGSASQLNIFFHTRRRCSCERHRGGDKKKKKTKGKKELGETWRTNGRMRTSDEMEGKHSEAG